MGRRQARDGGQTSGAVILELGEFVFVGPGSRVGGVEGRAVCPVKLGVTDIWCGGTDI